MDAILSLAALILTSEILGTFGALRRVPLVVGCAIVGIGSGVLARPASAAGEAADESSFEPSRLPRWAGAIALLAVALVVGQWVAHTATAESEGITNVDSLTYHLSHAARWAQDGNTTRLHYINIDFPDTFHPSNTELLHAFGMVIFERDILSPFVSLCWLGLGLLAAWCVGRPFGLGAATLVAGIVMFGAPLVLFQNAGTAGNDVAVHFLLLSSVALLLYPLRTRAVSVVAAVAAGLAIGTKLTAVVPAAAITVGLFVIARRGERRGLFAMWIAPFLAVGSYWYLRNLVRTGSPIPSIDLGIGPLPFPSPRFRIVDELGFSVADYLGNGYVWRKWFLPGLRADFGPAWWLTIGLAAAGVLALIIWGTPKLRMLGVAAAVAAAAYSVSPTTAFGPRNEPYLFAGNVIYLSPALILGLVLLPLAPPLRERRRALVVVCSLAAAVLAHQFATIVPVWPVRFRLVGIAAGIAVAVVGSGAAWLASNGRLRAPRSALAVTGVAVLIAVAVAGFPMTRNYLESRYAGLQFWSWAQPLRGERIGIAGLGHQYPLYGRTLENHVQYVGDPGPHGEFTSLGNCSEWRRALREGSYTYVALTARPTTDVIDREIPWTASDPAATELLRVGDGIVFRFDPSVPDPGC